MFHSRFKDAYYGFIVGDAFGVPYEFQAREMMKAFPALEMIGYGTYDQPKGTWSDDTSMMLCVIETLQQNEEINDLAKRFVQWATEGYLTPHGETFDIGITTRTAVAALKNGSSPLHSGANDPYSAGNGSLMRTVPYAFLGNDFNTTMHRLIPEHQITHNLPVCTQSSILYARILRNLAEGLNKVDAIHAARAYFRQPPASFLSPEIPELQRSLSADFILLDESKIASSGYVIHTLEAVIWCFMHSQSYSHAITLAVNLGEDTDTIAALTGALSAVHYGFEDIPEDWLESLQNKELLDNVLEKCQWMS